MSKKTFLLWVLFLGTNCASVYYADEIKAFLKIGKTAAAEGEEVYAGVIVPPELLSDSESDAHFAQSLLSEKIDWMFVDKVKMPEFMKVKGTGFGFKGIVQKK